MSKHETAPDFDPVLTPQQMIAEANIHESTWYKYWRPKLPVIRLSDRRIGVRRSDWNAALKAHQERGR